MAIQLEVGKTYVDADGVLVTIREKTGNGLYFKGGYKGVIKHYNADGTHKLGKIPTLVREATTSAPVANPYPELKAAPLAEAKPAGPRKSQPALPMPAWDSRPIDADNAMDAVRAMCKGY
jgi:hypothetical protein